MTKLERQLEESYNHIKPYISAENTTELFSMCKNCERWCGEEHDYSECRDLPCFKFWLGYEYLKWCNSWD